MSSNETNNAETNNETNASESSFKAKAWKYTKIGGKLIGEVVVVTVISYGVLYGAKKYFGTGCAMPDLG